MPPPVAQPRPTAELDRSSDQVYTGVMAMIRQVVQLKNEVNTLPLSEYPNAVKVVGVTLCSPIQSVDQILPSLHSSVTTEVRCHFLWFDFWTFRSRRHIISSADLKGFIKSVVCITRFLKTFYWSGGILEKSCCPGEGFCVSWT
ncbi:protein-tyrosine kinase 2-beta-like [Sphaeramia orbicularis]|uniref:protein-tyrosine kinase 2-beta-like n=1 Tax=Sphaeramia orbicularis TaxID=375764 RepID=UPI00117C91E5|nr:protein-tyrosine kinase 2-beta-like [Sphaeramia orbicularis]